MGKDIHKPVKQNDPSLNLEGGAPGRTWKKKKPKYIQGVLDFPTAKLEKLKKATNSVNT